MAKAQQAQIKRDNQDERQQSVYTAKLMLAKERRDVEQSAAWERMEAKTNKE